jgi:hypothetical protein
MAETISMDTQIYVSIVWRHSIIGEVGGKHTWVKIGRFGVFQIDVGSCVEERTQLLDWENEGSQRSDPFFGGKEVSIESEKPTDFVSSGR